MRMRSIVGAVAILTMMLLFVAPLAASIWLAQVAGTCIDQDGHPLTGATLVFRDPGTGHNFRTTTDSAGNFFFIAVEPGNYDIDLSKSGKVLFHVSAAQIPWSKQPTWVEFDLAHDVARVTPRQQMNEMRISPSPTPDAVAPREAGDAALAAAINAKLAGARKLEAAGDWDAAFSAYRDAIGLDPNRDIPWAQLGRANWQAARAMPSRVGDYLQRAADAYRHAIGLHPAAAYHNNLGQVYAKLARGDDAIAEFEAAEELEPGRRATYDFNIAVTMFDAAQVAGGTADTNKLYRVLGLLGAVTDTDPQNAEAYYLTGITLLRIHSSDPEWKPGAQVANALRNYLELAPDGRHATEVRAMLHSMTSIAPN